ncbi:50S ribosomal subunit l30 [Niveomyces insectorum RCEF 264]|uniref:Large ribosomal subunit protein mL46 n=1 Tax=Niveomyces insectorum RCEF 264 TaxID=1081102 RepID=A0A167MAF7_9HYPO|nr:50S ribosomal subunit l30 [Niveomyces insectorum RCEF 264]
MASTSRGGYAISALGRARTRPACAQCGSPFLRSTASRHPYSAAAAAEAATAAEQTTSPTPSPSSSSSTSSSSAAPRTAPAYRIRAGLLLSRPPLLTRDPTPFEAAFYLYQKRLNERLTGSFRRNVYFKPDTTPALDWKLQLRARQGTPARELTLQDPLAAELTDPARLRERILSDADLRVSEDGEPLAEADRVRVERPQPRTTAADAANDTRRLDRKLDRTLYLVVRGADGAWSFPTADVQTNENLHETAARALASAAGADMNTWIVGRVPIAHIVRTDPAAEEKIFFLKGRIMAGQANLEGNTLGLSDFKWLSKEELATELPAYYYASVKNAMPER